MHALLGSIVTAIRCRSGGYLYLDRLQGLDEPEIEALMSECPARFPDDLVAGLGFYGRTVRDPQLGIVVTIPHMRAMGLLTADQIRATRSLLRARTLEGPAYWDPGWLPIASDDPDIVDTELSAYDMIELDPDSPICGTVFRWTADQGRVAKLAPSYRAYLEGFRTVLDHPGLRWDLAGGFRF